jgi:tetratricopeptide (TPR) repeat protein
MAQQEQQRVGVGAWLGARFYLWRGSAHRHFGIRDHNLHEFARAVEDYTRALALDPGLGAAYLQRGVLYWRELDRATDAVADLTAALKVQPGWPEVLFCRGLAFQALGNWQAAIRDLSRYLASGDSTWREAAQGQLTLIRALVGEAQEE